MEQYLTKQAGPFGPDGGTQPKKGFPAKNPGPGPQEPPPPRNLPPREESSPRQCPPGDSAPEPVFFS